MMTNLKIGDKFTMAGCYKRRTFWQWLTCQPRELEMYEVVAEYHEGDPYVPVRTA